MRCLRVLLQLRRFFYDQAALFPNVCSLSSQMKGFELKVFSRDGDARSHPTTDSPVQEELRNGKTRQLRHVIGASVSLLAINREIARRPAILGQMLGTRRSSVTVAAQALQKAGLISYERGRVAITNRHGLEQAACDCTSIAGSVLKIPSGLSRYRNERTVAG